MSKTQPAGPVLVVRPEIARRNLRRMLDKCEKSQTILRPHFKTHQSRAVGRWFREAGVDRITVSNMDMAEYFAADGWDNILLCIPVNLRAIGRYQRLAREIDLHLVVDHPEVANKLGNDMEAPVKVWIEMDTGDGRSGIPPRDQEMILETARVIRDSAHLHLEGLISHAGHSYTKLSVNHAEKLFRESMATLEATRKHLLEHDLGDEIKLSLGDTPTFSLLEKFDGLDEARPGNFIFYDLMQVEFGVCDHRDIAVAVACPVISRNPDRGEIIVHGGAVHFSKDHIYLPDKPYDCYGIAVRPANERGWNLRGESFLIKLSQEHGVMDAIPNSTLEEYDYGDLVFFLPVHSCLTVAAMREFWVLENGAFRLLEDPEI